MEAAACHKAYAAKRAISLRQLREVGRLIDQRCEKEAWEGLRMSFAGGQMKWAPTKLTPDTVNIYDIVEHLIVPACAEAKCSYVELVGAGGDQTPTWVVSVFAGHSILGLIQAIEMHATDHSLSEDATYWLEPFAKNLIEHQPADAFAWSDLERPAAPVDDAPKDLGASVFAQAVTLAEGRVLTVVDEAAILFSRMTCIVEMFLGLQGQHEMYMAGVGAEHHFSKEICEKGKHFDAQHGKANKPVFKATAMNWIVSKDPACAEFNAKVRARFEAVLAGAHKGQATKSWTMACVLL